MYTKNELIKIFKETREKYYNNEYVKNECVMGIYELCTLETEIKKNKKIINDDYISLALKNIKEYDEVVIVNPIHPTDPRMDGWRCEELYRRTSLFMNLKKIYLSYTGLHENITYLKNVAIMRKSRKEKYEFLEKPEKISVVNYISKRFDNKEDAKTEEVCDYYKDIFRKIFTINYKNTNALIIISSKDCMRHNNDPETLGKAINYAIDSKLLTGDIIITSDKSTKKFTDEFLFYKQKNTPKRGRHHEI